MQHRASQDLELEAVGHGEVLDGEALAVTQQHGLMVLVTACDVKCQPPATPKAQSSPAGLYGDHTRDGGMFHPLDPAGPSDWQP